MIHMMVQKSGDHQVRLVVYHCCFQGFCTGGAGFFPINSMIPSVSYLNKNRYRNKTHDQFLVERIQSSITKLFKSFICEMTSWLLVGSEGLKLYILKNSSCDHAVSNS